MPYDKLLNKAQVCAQVSQVRIIPGRDVYQQGVLVGKDPDLCQFTVVPVILPLNPLNDEFSLWDSAAEQKLAIKISKIDQAGKVEAIVDVDEPPPW
jgi:hypothetical protein